MIPPEQLTAHDGHSWHHRDPNCPECQSYGPREGRATDKELLEMATIQLGDLQRALTRLRRGISTRDAHIARLERDLVIAGRLIEDFATRRVSHEQIAVRIQAFMETLERRRANPDVISDPDG